MVSRLTVLAAASALWLGASASAHAADDSPAPTPQTWAIHAQTTFVEQANAAFRSPYSGANSLNPHAVGRETWDVTVYAGRWALRLGGFNLSDVPNSTQLETDFSQYEVVGEIEERHSIGGREGKLKLTGFLNHGRMGRFDDAVRLAQATGQPADIAAVRRVQSRTGLSLNLEQQLAADLGLFVRAGVADGGLESYEFTDIDRTVSAGLSLGGRRWGRPDDVFALAGVVNQASKARERFLDAGGLGILIGDGRLPHPGAEEIVETYYDLAALHAVRLSFDYQFIEHPAYNRDRGPVSVGAVRLHAAF